MEQIIVVKMVKGMFRCPEPNCSKAYKIHDSLTRHAKRRHSIIISKTSRVPRQLQTYNNLKRFREKNGVRRSARLLNRKKQLRPLFDEEDADKRGIFECAQPILEYRQSKIPNAGNGIFALEQLYKGDIVTWYSGTHVTTRTTDALYTIKTPDGFIEGIRAPEKSQGMASFINREDRKTRGARKNCEFVLYFENGETPRVYIEILKNILKGCELYLTYWKSYIIRNRKRKIPRNRGKLKRQKDQRRKEEVQIYPLIWQWVIPGFHNYATPPGSAIAT